MSNLRIPLFRGRPLILFPANWKHGWCDPEQTLDPNAALSRKWQSRDWQEFREDHYLGIMLSPFGYDRSDPLTSWPGIPYAPHGMSIHSEPKLHPADE